MNCSNLFIRIPSFGQNFLNFENCHSTRGPYFCFRYDFCIREKVVDGNLIAKWKKPGYEFLCSLAAINKGSTNFGTTNICRVPLRLRSGKIAPSVLTGCISCASCDKVAGPRAYTNTIPVFISTPSLLPHCGSTPSL